MRENKNYYTSIGLFTSSILVLAFLSIYWLLRDNQYDGKPMNELVVRIPGSVSGLSVESKVRFNGIAIGNVTGLYIDSDDPTYSIAKTIVRSDAPIYTSTTAKIGMQGITGVPHIELSNVHKKGQKVFQIANERNEIATITAYPSVLNSFLTNTEEILLEIKSSSNTIKNIVDKIAAPINKTVKNFETISTILVKNISLIDKISSGDKKVSSDFTQIINNITGIVKKVDKIVDNIDTRKISKIIGNIQIASDDFIKTSTQVNNTINGLQKTTQTFQGVGKKAADILSDVSSTMHSKEMSSSMDNIFKATDNIQESTSAIRNMSSQLAEIMDKIKNLTGTQANKSFLEEAHHTIKSFKNTADKLDAYITPIANNLQNFSGSGLNDLHSLIINMQESINHFDYALNTIENNPQKIIWGTESVKQYKPKH
ncbi:MAG: MCE family protein [Candidatus Liberibacter europaeus]|uniref:MCE family protein n=1 Tax=Candidatus Liberibacter europaeus TaxID=744859 RepID=A0A2T4VY78_9HYPH|nr:MCE family protein [Candidatus Liberibacter europaeus]PTL86733.1 MAG: MCE family protein [Candidatus Liberibacter europaeus]